MHFHKEEEEEGEEEEGEEEEGEEEEILVIEHNQVRF